MDTEVFFQTELSTKSVNALIRRVEQLLSRAESCFGIYDLSNAMESCREAENQRALSAMSACLAQTTERCKQIESISKGVDGSIKKELGEAKEHSPLDDAVNLLEKFKSNVMKDISGMEKIIDDNCAVQQKALMKIDKELKAITDNNKQDQEITKLENELAQLQKTQADLTAQFNSLKQSIGTESPR